jgi:sarcosine oxidase delta subunit
MSVKKVECPFCGFIYQTDVDEIYKDGKTTVIREASESTTKSKKLMIDLTCPHCKEDFEFEWQTK